MFFNLFVRFLFMRADRYARPSKAHQTVGRKCLFTVVEGNQNTVVFEADDLSLAVRIGLERYAVTWYAR